MPYRCRDCKSYFSLKTNTPMQDSKLPLRLWAWAIYLEMTSLKGVSSMKLHRDLGIRQASAWHMLHRIREAFMDVAHEFEGPVEVDEAYFGGLERNKHARKRRGEGRGPSGKTPVAGIRDRKTRRMAAKVLNDTTKASLREFADAHRRPGVKTYTDESRSYDGMENRERRAPFGGRVRARHGAHERRGVVLGDAEAGAQGRVPQFEREALAALREPVRRSPQRQGHGHAGANAARLGGHGRPSADVPRSHNRSLNGNVGLLRRIFKITRNSIVDDSQAPPAVEVSIEENIPGHGMAGIWRGRDTEIDIVTKGQQGPEQRQQQRPEQRQEQVMDDDAISHIVDELKQVAKTDGHVSRHEAVDVSNRISADGLSGTWMLKDRKLLWDTLIAAMSDDKFGDERVIAALCLVMRLNAE